MYKKIKICKCKITEKIYNFFVLFCRFENFTLYPDAIRTSSRNMKLHYIMNKRVVLDGLHYFSLLMYIGLILRVRKLQ